MEPKCYPSEVSCNVVGLIAWKLGRILASVFRLLWRAPREILKGIAETILWVCHSRGAALALLILAIPVVLAALRIDLYYVLSTPVLWLFALALLAIVRGPLRDAPSFLRKVIQIIAATAFSGGLLILLMWEPVHQAALKAEEPARAIWFLTVCLTFPVWLAWIVWIGMKRATTGQVAVGSWGDSTRTDRRMGRNIPRVRFADMGGATEAKEAITRLVKTQMAGGKTGIVRNGILLYGPRGTGKTFLAEATAGEFKLHYHYLSPNKLAHKWVGETEAKIRSEFAVAKSCKPVLFFIDEIDTVGARRQALDATSDPGGAAKGYNSIVETIMNQVVEYRSVPGFIIMAATNLLDGVDKALIREGRFDLKLRIDLPDQATRLQIFEAQLSRHRWAKFGLHEFARRTPGASAARIQALVDEAATFALEEKRKIEERDLRRALESIGGKDRAPLERVEWNDVVLDELITQELHTIVRLLGDPMRHEKLGIAAPAGLLLIGPPGTGKTLIAKLIASQSKRSFYPITSADVLRGNTGGSVNRVTEIFARAKEHNPSLIFIDEIDGLVPVADHRVSQHDIQVVEQFLTEISDLRPEHNVFLVGTTNRPESIDPRILRGGRFSEKITIGLPGDEARQRLLEKYLNGTHFAAGTTFGAVCDSLKGLSPADLEAICAAAKRMAYSRAKEADELPPLEWDDFEQAIARVRGKAAAQSSIGFRQ